MRVVLQRVKRASVSVDQQTVGKIDQGYLLLVGFAPADGQKEIDYLVHKISNLRIFSDDEGKLNFDIHQIGGQILSVSQFTLYAALRKGNRPGFSLAQDPAVAKINYQKFNQALRAEKITVAEGIFGADMQVSLVNDGPVTLIYDTEHML
ncbi:MAG: D-aminoacyl-tRNA deacylase [Liquorilactobacillus ghanensis]|jgi:D-tyrosyl-tRNA(Tyr) deacylase|uniref:D-aminoacyl-tRNA deacylase n=1 Tax=Liquorilactobacillus ghanensis DSM 18630 TaxID=1423750 RepID=A0A0R1VZL3_9LACO|nr:D-aminoacyl-tRNA deacylase [Liquorilactobacillus ghanensis]KRM08310.1 D-tyrosyl-tRNA(Tyr) deacylase [Liquorilactobacillus ghanensis DSM 18630]